MPPLGPLYRQDVIVDEALAEHRDIVFDAGSHRESIRMPYSQFARLVRPTVAAFGIAPPHVSTRSERSILIDAVCGVRVGDDAAWGWSDYHGRRYYFCSAACKMEFDDNPAEYA